MSLDLVRFSVNVEEKVFDFLDMVAQAFNGEVKVFLFDGIQDAEVFVNGSLHPPFNLRGGNHEQPLRIPDVIKELPEFPVFRHGNDGLMKPGVGFNKFLKAAPPLFLKQFSERCHRKIVEFFPCRF